MPSKEEKTVGAIESLQQKIMALAESEPLAPRALAALCLAYVDYAKSTGASDLAIVSAVVAAIKTNRDGF